MQLVLLKIFQNTLIGVQVQHELSFILAMKHLKAEEIKQSKKILQLLIWLSKKPKQQELPFTPILELLRASIKQVSKLNMPELQPQQVDNLLQIKTLSVVLVQS